MYATVYASISRTPDSLLLSSSFTESTAQIHLPIDHMHLRWPHTPSYHCSKSGVTLWMTRRCHYSPWLVWSLRAEFATGVTPYSCVRCIFVGCKSPPFNTGSCSTKVPHMIWSQRDDARQTATPNASCNKRDSFDACEATKFIHVTLLQQLSFLLFWVVFLNEPILRYNDWNSAKQRQAL